MMSSALFHGVGISELCKCGIIYNIYKYKYYITNLENSENNIGFYVA